MILATSRPCLSAILLAFLAFLPSSAFAGMTPEEVAAFQKVQKRNAAGGDARDQYILGYYYAVGKGVVKDEVEAVKWYRKAADQGNASAQSTLGRCYTVGKGVATDEVEAVKWYRKAADQGEALAQYNLGVRYANGEGVPKDEIESYAYFILAGITIEEARPNQAFLEKKLSTEARLRGQQRAREFQKEIEAKLALQKQQREREFQKEIEAKLAAKKAGK